MAPPSFLKRETCSCLKRFQPSATGLPTHVKCIEAQRFYKFSTKPPERGKMRIDMSYEGWQFWSLAALALIVLTALLTDVRQGRIPNTLILVALCAGVLVNVLGPEAFNRSAGLFTSLPGALGVKGAVLGALTGLAAFLPFYMLRAMGAGDVKHRQLCRPDHGGEPRIVHTGHGRRAGCGAHGVGAQIAAGHGQCGGCAGANAARLGAQL
jgi:hypothetical protein